MSTRAHSTRTRTANESLRPLYQTMLDTADRLEEFGRLGVQRKRELNLSIRKLREAANLSHQVCFGAFAAPLTARDHGAAERSKQAAV